MLAVLSRRTAPNYSCSASSKTINELLQQSLQKSYPTTGKSIAISDFGTQIIVLSQYDKETLINVPYILCDFFKFFVSNSICLSNVAIFFERLILQKFITLCYLTLTGEKGVQKCWLFSQLPTYLSQRLSKIQWRSSAQKTSPWWRESIGEH